MLPKTYESKTVRDRMLELRVVAALQTHDIVSLEKILVEVRGGIAILRGQVQTVYEKQLASRTARLTEGIAGVVNQINIAPPSAFEVTDPIVVRYWVLGGVMLLALAVGAVLLPGRMPWSDTRPAVFPVAGKVLIDGQAASGALIVCYPKSDAANGPRPKASADKNGNFRLSTFEPGDGAPSGEYLVTVEWPQWIGTGEDSRYVNLLAPEYRSPRTTKLRATVAMQPENRVVLLIYRKPPAGGNGKEAPPANQRKEVRSADQRALNLGD